MSQKIATPTQLGFSPPEMKVSTNKETGEVSVDKVNVKDSLVTIGRDISVGWEAIGPGYGARPDALGTFRINLTAKPKADEEKFLNIASVEMDAKDIYDLFYNADGTKKNENSLSVVKFVPKEVHICEEVVAKNPDGSESTEVKERLMVILASQSYDLPPEKPSSNKPSAPLIPFK